MLAKLLGANCLSVQPEMPRGNSDRSYNHFVCGVGRGAVVDGS